MQIRSFAPSFLLSFFSSFLVKVFCELADWQIYQAFVITFELMAYRREVEVVEVSFTFLTQLLLTSTYIKISDRRNNLY